LFLFNSKFFESNCLHDQNKSLGLLSMTTAKLRLERVH
jgi:hypothetical protein